MRLILGLAVEDFHCTCVGTPSLTEKSNLVFRGHNKAYGVIVELWCMVLFFLCVYSSHVPCELQSTSMYNAVICAVHWSHMYCMYLWFGFMYLWSSEPYIICMQ